MPGTYAPAAGSIASRIWSSVTMAIGTDAPNSSNVTAGPKAIADKVNAVLTSAGFLGLASTWTALQTFSSGISIPTPTSQVINVNGGAAPAYASSSVTGNTNSRYWADSDGSINLRIAITYSGASSSNITLFTLPVGFRPTNTVGCGLGSNSTSNAELFVASTGAVSILLTTAVTTGNFFAYMKWHPAD